MFEKKQFNKITIVTIALVACLLVLSIIFSIRAFRSTSYIVYVEDKIYDEYIKTAPLPQKDLGLIFVKESERCSPISPYSILYLQSDGDGCLRK